MPDTFCLGGVVLTSREWEALDDAQRAQLLAALLRRDDPWSPPALGAGWAGAAPGGAPPSPGR